MRAVAAVREWGPVGGGGGSMSGLFGISFGEGVGGRGWRSDIQGRESWDAVMSGMIPFWWLFRRV